MKDLDITDDRWNKRGAVPYKLYVESRNRRQEACWHYQKGRCTKGENCLFRHEPPHVPEMPEQNKSTNSRDKEYEKKKGQRIENYIDYQTH